MALNKFFQNKISSEKILNKVKESFRNINSKKESFDNVLKYWGGVGYFFFVVFALIIAKFDLFLFGKILAPFFIIYFSWHIYAIVKCKPKKKKPTEAEKKQKRKDFWKRFYRKLMLKESLNEWNPPLVFSVIDLFIITHFLEFLV